MKILALLALALVFIMVGRHQQARRARQAKEGSELEPAQLLVAETGGFIQAIQQLGMLPSLRLPQLHLQPEEFALLHHAGAHLISYPAIQVPSGKPPSPTFAGLEFYPGVWQAQHSDKMSVLAQGDLFLTNQRLLFLGEPKTLVILWRDLLSVTADLTSIRIASSESETPLYLTVRNPLLWAAFILWMSSGDVRQPRLAPGTELTLSREGSGIQQIIRLAPAPLGQSATPQ